MDGIALFSYGQEEYFLFISLCVENSYRIRIPLTYVALVVQQSLIEKKISSLH